MPEVVLYTCIVGSCTDQLKALPELGEGVEAHAFLDADKLPKHPPKGWNVHGPSFNGTHNNNPRLLARQHKLLAHELFPRVPVTMWVDGCLTPKYCPGRSIKAWLGDHDLMTYRHSERNCIYQEAEASIRLKKGQKESIREQVERYRQAGHPYNGGLAETSVLIRVNCPVISRFNAAWWKELSQNSHRDQISFPYVAAQEKVTWGEIPGSAWSNKDFAWVSHWK